MFETVRKVADMVDMGRLLKSSPYELSGGQKQRVAFAGVMVDDVDVLLFDEPLANLDPATGKTAIDLIDKVTADSKFSFWARVHSSNWFGEHFGVAVSQSGNSSAADFETIDEWSMTKADGDGWRKYTVDLSAYEGKEVYVAIRHFFTDEQWVALDYGFDVYILHIDDAMFQNVVDILSLEFYFQRISFEALTVTRFAFQYKVSHKLHFYGQFAFSLACFAASTRSVK